MVSYEVALSICERTHIAVRGATTKIVNLVKVRRNGLIEYVESRFEEAGRLMKTHAANTLVQLLAILIIRSQNHS